MNHPLETSICRTPGELEAVATEWDSLLDRSPSSSVFLTWDWLHSWWRHIGSDAALSVVLVREPGGRLVGVAPLCVRPEGRVPRRRVLQFLGTRFVSSDYLDVLAESALEQQVAGAIWNALQAEAGNWDWIRLSDVLPDSMVARVLLRHDGASRVMRQDRHGQYCPYLSLADSREGFRKSLGPSMRQNLRKKIQRLEEGGVRFGWLEEPGDLERALQDFYALHEMRWRTRDMAGNFADPRVRAFHGEIVTRMAPRGRVRLYFLWHGERAVAALYALQYKRTLFCYQTGFDPIPPDPSIRATKYSPGLVVIGRSMEDAIDRGLGEFDFLRGPEPYKFEWTSSRRTTTTVELASRARPAGVAGMAGLRLELMLKRPIRRLLRRTAAAGGGT